MILLSGRIAIPYVVIATLYTTGQSVVTLYGFGGHRRRVISVPERAEAELMFLQDGLDVVLGSDGHPVQQRGCSNPCALRLSWIGDRIDRVAAAQDWSLHYDRPTGRILLGPIEMEVAVVRDQAKLLVHAIWASVRALEDGSLDVFDSGSQTGAGA
jgi:hypothetical protein